MQLPEPVYGDLTMAENGTSGDDEMPRVRSRPGGKSLRSRLRQIVSMYVPNVPTEGDTDVGDHTELLKPVDSSSEISAINSDRLYDIKKVYTGKTIVKSMTDAIGVPAFMESGQMRHIVAIAANENTIYVALQELPYVFLLDAYTNEEEQALSEGRSRTDSDISVVKNCIHLNIHKIGDIVPQELCIHSPTPDTTVLYVVGWIKDTEDTTVVSIKKRWLLATFSLNGRAIARTAVYDYQRYSGLTIDATDGQLLLTCPQLPEVSNGTIPNPDRFVGQICKLTSTFERRLFSVTMGNHEVAYRPEFVSQVSAGNCCWASVLKLVHEKGAAKPVCSRRLFAFPGCQPAGANGQKTREWLHIASWDFANLNPGRIAAFDTRRLLVLDHSNGTLSYITWSADQPTPSLFRITRPSSRSIDLVCSTYQPNRNADSQTLFPPLAYLVSESNIFKFSFREANA